MTDTPASQTLDRGLRVLEILAATGQPQPVNRLSEALGVHRSVAYRLIRTLEDHRLVERDAAGHYHLGIGTAALARGVRSPLQAVAGPVLRELADALGMTAFLVVRGGDEAVTVLSVEPASSSAHVAYRPGNRHPVEQGAPGLALLMAESPAPGDTARLTEARARGWAESHGEVIGGLLSVAAPVGRTAAVAVVFIDQRIDTVAVAGEVVVAAQRIGAALN